MIIEYEDIPSASRKQLAAAYPKLSIKCRMLQAENARLLALIADYDVSINAVRDSLAERDALVAEKAKADSLKEILHRTWKN